MSGLSSNQIQNLSQIQAIKNARIQTVESLEIMQHRIDTAWEDINNLRAFANKKKGNHVYDHCMFLANDYERRLRAIIGQ